MDLALACAFSVLAGFVDAVAGGGGLIQLPALLALLPGVPVTTVLGTNKGASVFGTSVAAIRYARSVEVPWRSVVFAAAMAFAGSFVGAGLAKRIDPAFMRPLVLAMLLAVAAWTYFRPGFGMQSRGRELPIAAAALGALLGLYDGFFGPGTGTFLLVAFSATLGLDFLGASAAAKVVNVATNLAAIVAFQRSGDILWAWSLPMAACNMVGGLLGARTAIARGSGFVRKLVLVVVLALVAKVGWEWVGS
jgi:uncharacterized membrane protein YfcA